MAVFTLERKQIVPWPAAKCWAFYSNPINLEKITPPSLRFRILTPLSAGLHGGQIIRYRVSPLFGIPITWVTEITHVQEPNYFCDEQRMGPYRLWHHEHFFRALDRTRTEVRDLVHYAPPFGPMGAILNALLIRPQLERIFSFRAQTLAAMSSSEQIHSHAHSPPE